MQRARERVERRKAKREERRQRREDYKERIREQREARQRRQEERRAERRRKREARRQKRSRERMARQDRGERAEALPQGGYFIPVTASPTWDTPAFGSWNALKFISDGRFEWKGFVQ